MQRLRGFTLIEILVTLSIVAVLAGLMLPALGAVRNSARRTTAAERIATIGIAIDVYRQEDAQRRYPPVEADRTLRTATPSRTLDLLAMVGLAWQGHELAGDPLSDRTLVDPWRQPYRYQCDAVIDGTADRPADLDGWNARGIEPWAYVWSTGPRAAGTAVDAEHAKDWIYHRTTP